MRFIFNHYTFENNKTKKDISFALFSDIHFSSKTNIKELYDITLAIACKNLDYIFIPGDIIDDINHLRDQNRVNLFLDWFKNLGSIATTFISLGNHDFNKRNGELIRDEKFLKDLSSINNVYLLDNQYYEDSNIKVFGFTSIYDEKNEKHKIKEYIEYLNHQNIEFNNQKFNILMAHSPQKLASSNVFNKINNLDNIDLILCGHMHNGLFFPIMDKLIKGNRGIISPYKSPFPNYARGKFIKKYKNKEISFIISGGICKLSASAKFLEPLHKLYPSAIELITVKRGDKWNN